MQDPTGTDRVAFWLAFVHPAVMVTGIALSVLALRAGLGLRSARRSRRPRRAADVRRHVRLSKPALVVLAAGFVGGPVSAVWLRGWDPFATAHGWVALAAVALFAATGVLGRRLERGTARPLDAHALLGVLSVLAAAAAFGTGFVLLP